MSLVGLRSKKVAVVGAELLGPELEEVCIQIFGLLGMFGFGTDR